MDDRRLKVLVTGGGRGLGRAISGRLSRQGAAVGVLVRTAREVEETVGSIRDEGGGPRLSGRRARCRPIEGGRRAFSRMGGGSRRIAMRHGEPARPADRVGRSRNLVARSWRPRSVAPGTRSASRSPRSAIRPGDDFPPVGPGHNGALPFATGYGVAQAGRPAGRVVGPGALGRRDRGLRRNPGLVPTDLTRPLIQSAEGRRGLPRFQEALAEGKEVDAEVVAETVQWLIERRPEPLNGRVVAAPATPTILETRLDRIRGRTGTCSGSADRIGSARRILAGPGIPDGRGRLLPVCLEGYAKNMATLTIRGVGRRSPRRPAYPRFHPPSTHCPRAHVRE